MNTFFKAILLATANKRMMQYSDEWRAFHNRLSMDDREDIDTIKIDRRNKSNQNYNSIDEGVRL